MDFCVNPDAFALKPSSVFILCIPVDFAFVSAVDLISVHPPLSAFELLLEL